MKNLPENFIPNRNTDWYDISKNYQLSEEFIERHFNKLDVFLVSFYQNLSEDFIEKHISKLSLTSICLNKNILRRVKINVGFKSKLINSKRLFFRKKFLEI